MKALNEFQHVFSQCLLATLEHDMAKPKIAKRAPYIVQLTPGKYWWCACGKSANQPFCDGSHQGGEFTPLKVTITSMAPVALCGCKHSGDKPYCDGSHSCL